jgi:hypothetical protein
MTRYALVAGLVGSWLSFPGLALAEEAAPVASDVTLRPVVGFAALDRPTGILEAGLGWLTLPNAEVCQADCSKGDTSIEADVWQLFRGSTRLALGAGLMIGLIPTNAGGQEHRRSYMTVEGTARYYPYVGENVEWWVGVTGGLVVVSDKFLVGERESDKALLGPHGQTIRTEGGAIGLAGGPVISLTTNWTVGCTARYGEWFLPTQPAYDVLGHQASLTGRSTFVSLGCNVAFRLAL